MTVMLRNDVDIARRVEQLKTQLTMNHQQTNHPTLQPSLSFLKYTRDEGWNVCAPLSNQRLSSIKVKLDLKLCTALRQNTHFKDMASWGTTLDSTLYLEGTCVTSPYVTGSQTEHLMSCCRSAEKCSPEEELFYFTVSFGLCRPLREWLTYKQVPPWEKQ